MRRIGGLALTILLLAGPALAGKLEKHDKELLGTWYGPYGLAFEVQSDGSCSIMGRQGMCTATAGKLNFTPLIGQRAEYRYTFQAGFLIVNDPAQTQPLVLQRMQNQAPPAARYAPAPAPQYPPQAAPQYAAPAAQYAPAPTPQYAPQPAPQYAPKAAPQPVPQYPPQPVTQYAPQPAPQYPAPQYPAPPRAQYTPAPSYPPTVAPYAPAPATPPAPQYAPAPAPPPPTPEPPSKPGKPGRAEAPVSAPTGRGTFFSKESWGASLTVPGGWRGAEKDGMLVMGGESEAGLIVVRFAPKINREAMLAEYARGLHEGGMNLMPAAPAQDYRASGAKGVAGELVGMGPDGAQVKGRAIGLLSSFGGGLVVFGVTAADKYPTLKARTEAVAHSVSFTAPKMPKSAEVLAGRYEYVYVSPTGGYSRESKITLCSDGRFSKGGEMAGSGRFGYEAPTNWGAAPSHDNGGTWSSQGDATQGTIILNYNGGQSETLEYRVSQDPKDRSPYGSGVTIGSTKYQKTGPGQCS
jgi:hypothetical protein